MDRLEPTGRLLRLTISTRAPLAEAGSDLQG